YILLGPVTAIGCRATRLAVSRPRELCECPDYLASDLASRPECLASSLLRAESVAQHRRRWSEGCRGMTVDSSMDVEAVRPVARNRTRTSGRPYRVHVRLTSEEWHDIRAAAARAGLKPTAYAGVAAVEAARALVADIRA